MKAVPIAFRVDLARINSVYAALATLVVSRLIVSLLIGLVPVDDSYITFRYALNIVEGYGFVYNAGERVLGTTTPLWTLVLAGAGSLGAAIPQAALVIGALLDAAVIALVFDVVRLSKFSARAALAGAALYAVSADALALGVMGMESPLFNVTIWAALSATLRRRYVFATSVAAAAFLTRPEGLALFVVVAAVMWLRRDRPPVAAVLVPAVMVGAWVAFAAAYFGSPVPQSLAAKAAGEADVALSALNLVRFFFVDGIAYWGLPDGTIWQLPALLTALATVGILRGLRDARTDGNAAGVVSLFGFPVLYVLPLAAVGAFTSFPWYFAPIIPFLAASAAVGLDAISARLPNGGRRAAFLAASVVLFACLHVGAWVLHKLPLENRNHWLDGLAASVSDVPRSSDVVVAAREIGVIGWVAYPAHIDDLYGLVTPAAVGTDSRDFVRSHRPDFVSFHTQEASFLLDLIGDGYTVHTRVRDPFYDRDYFLLRAVTGS